MNDYPNEHEVAEATRTLASLNEQANGMRAELTKLRQELEEAQREFNGTQAAQLLEANEQLVLAALHAQAVAETAASDRDDWARSSQYDALTDTPNRALMLDRLESAIAMARRHKTHIAVLFLDIDHFKQINDTLGHAVGDEVLQLVAHRLESVVRDADTVSRHSGDEFLVLLTDVTQASDAGLIAEKILSAIAAAGGAGGHELHLSASLGIAVCPEDGEDAAALIDRADAAMYRSKRRGRGGFEFYTEDISISHRVVMQPSATEMPRLPAVRRESAPAEREPCLLDMREANEQLLITALTARETQAHAEEANRRQSDFLAMVAHELRHPLNPIRVAADLLDRARMDEPLLARLKGVIERQTAHMSRLVEDLLDGSRIGAGKFKLERSVVEMADILKLAVETCRPALDARHQRLRMRLPPGPLIVIGDPVRLAQVFDNLLDNASKYTPQGGNVALTVAVREHAMVITVSDNGIGITAEALPNIFDLFAQDACAYSLRDGGLGIGLAVTRNLVEAHGGTVVASSAGKGLGSEFTVTLWRE